MSGTTYTSKPLDKTDTMSGIQIIMLIYGTLYLFGKCQTFCTTFNNFCVTSFCLMLKWNYLFPNS